MSKHLANVLTVGMFTKFFVNGLMPSTLDLHCVLLFEALSLERKRKTFLPFEP